MAACTSRGWKTVVAFAVTLLTTWMYHVFELGVALAAEPEAVPDADCADTAPASWKGEKLLSDGGAARAWRCDARRGGGRRRRAL
jgi:hypothetical protein